ncbi:MAG TPA: hypothetical protein VIN06_03960 [Devosia sp.]
MNDDDETVLLNAAHYKALIPIVNCVRSRGMARDEAWLFAGALLQYTANGKIDRLIMKHTAPLSDEFFTGKVGTINQELRSGRRSEGMDGLIELFTRGLGLLPDYIPPRGQIPTRMMEPYEDIDAHYAVGKVLIMAEVGSVGKVKPPSDSQYYKRRYRLEFDGGLKDISNLNAAQQEVLYAPGSHYRVEAIRDGKVKDKKGIAGSPQAHRHITLKFLRADSPEVRNTAPTDLIDLRQ